MISPYGVYPLADGAEILIAVQNHAEWVALCTDVFEQPELADDPRFATNEDRIGRIDEFEPVLRAALVAVPAEEMRRRLAAARIAVSSVHDPLSLWEHDQLRARDRFVTTELPTGSFDTYRSPFNIDGAEGAAPKVPALGEHDPELLAELERRAVSRRRL
jgi:formyl-CoA transferase